MRPKYKTKYRVGNWAEYDRALVRRGDVTLWLTPDAIATWAAAGVGRRSGQLQYSDLAIETALTLSLIFHLPLRQTEGFLTSIFGMLGVDLTAPDHTTLSRRGQHLALALRRARSDLLRFRFCIAAPHHRGVATTRDMCCCTRFRSSLSAASWAAS